MIIWSGLGFMPVLILVLIGMVLSLSQTGPPGGFTVAVALLLTGFASGGLGWFLRKRGERVVVDKATGKEITLRQSHSLFFIPMFYWGPIFILMSLYAFIEAALKQ